NLRAALSQPLLAVSETSLLIASGEHTQVTFGATVSGEFTAEVADAAIATAHLDVEQKVLRVTGRSVGQTTVQLRCGGAAARVTITVKKRAGRLHGDLTAYVTHRRAPAALIERAVLNAVLTSARLEPGSTLSVGLDAARAEHGASPTRVRVPVKMTGPDYLPLVLQAEVPLQSRPLPPTAARALIVSNAPESVARRMTLREAMLSPQKVSRLLYHHKNVSAMPMALVVELVNLNEQDAEVGVIEGNGGAAPDEMGVGHRAAVSFMTYRESALGYYVRVPAEHTYRLIVHRLPPQWTASGLIELCPTGSLSVLVRVRTVPVDGGETRLMPAEPTLRPQESPEWTFPQVDKTVEAEYRVGGNWTFIPFGRVPIRSTDGKRSWEGNFGVTYAVTVRITNPLSVSAKVEFVFEPVAGAAAGTFVVGENIIETPVLKPPHEFTFHTVALAPQETRTVTFLTLPQSGSNYPANVVVRAK
ncbi:MAG: hypothetical protein NZT92_07330, partial [Abditibacteriales bacterium]|nr:hypothetical protein [Abditibacteriales bacterium]MDW8364667.1 hypothetical protein [Abditibacteriales bacterium]